MQASFLFTAQTQMGTLSQPNFIKRQFSSKTGDVPRLSTIPTRYSGPKRSCYATMSMNQNSLQANLGQSAKQYSLQMAIAQNQSRFSQIGGFNVSKQQVMPRQRSSTIMMASSNDQNPLTDHQQSDNYIQKIMENTNSVVFPTQEEYIRRLNVISILQYRKKNQKMGTSQNFQKMVAVAHYAIAKKAHESNTSIIKHQSLDDQKQPFTITHHKTKQEIDQEQYVMLLKDKDLYDEQVKEMTELAYQKNLSSLPISDFKQIQSLVLTQRLQPNFNDMKQQLLKCPDSPRNTPKDATDEDLQDVLSCFSDLSDFQKDLVIEQYKSEQSQRLLQQPTETPQKFSDTSSEYNITDKLSDHQFRQILQQGVNGYQQTLFDLFQSCLDRIKKEEKGLIQEDKDVLDLIRERKIHKLEINLIKPYKEFFRGRTGPFKAIGPDKGQRLIESTKEDKLKDPETEAVNKYLQKDQISDGEIQEQPIKEEKKENIEEALDLIQQDILNEKPVDEPIDLFPPVDGVQPLGWGSKIISKFDDDGKLLELQREPNESDAKQAASYISFLSWLFRHQSKQERNQMDYERSKMEKMYSKEHQETSESRDILNVIRKYDMDFIDSHLEKQELEDQAQETALKKKIQKDFHRNFLQKIIRGELPSSDLQMLVNQLYQTQKELVPEWMQTLCTDLISKANQFQSSKSLDKKSREETMKENWGLLRLCVGISKEYAEQILNIQKRHVNTHLKEIQMVMELHQKFLQENPQFKTGSQNQQDGSNDLKEPLGGNWTMEQEYEKVDRPKGMSAWSIKQKKIRAQQEKQNTLSNLEKAFKAPNADHVEPQMSAEPKLKANTEDDTIKQDMTGQNDTPNFISTEDDEEAKIEEIVNGLNYEALQFNDVYGVHEKLKSLLGEDFDFISVGDGPNKAQEIAKMLNGKLDENVDYDLIDKVADDAEKDYLEDLDRQIDNKMNNFNTLKNSVTNRSLASQTLKDSDFLNNYKTELEEGGKAEKWVLEAFYKLNKMQYTIINNGGKHKFRKLNSKQTLYDQIQVFKQDLMDLQIRVFDQKKVLKEAMAPKLYEKSLQETEAQARDAVAPIFKDYNVQELSHDSSFEKLDIDQWIEEATIFKNFTGVLNELDIQLLFLVEMKKGLDALITKYTLKDKTSLPEFAQIILDCSISQLKQEVLWIYNINSETSDNFDQVLTDELNELILLASTRLEKFTELLEKRLDKVNYMVLSKIFLFSEISEYIANGQKRPGASSAKISSQMQNEMVSSSFKRKVEDIKNVLLSQYAYIDQNQGKEVRKEQYKQLDEIIEKLDWLIIGHNIGKSNKQGQASGDREKDLFISEKIAETKFTKQEQAWRDENLSPYDKFMLSEFDKKVKQLWPQPGAVDIGKQPTKDQSRSQKRDEGLNDLIAKYLFQNTGNYNLKFEKTSLNDIEIESVASIFSVLTDAQCTHYLENHEMIWDLEDLDLSDLQRKKIQTLLLSQTSKQEYLDKRAKKVSQETKRQDLNLKQGADSQSKVSFKGIEIDTTQARVRINVLKDEINKVFKLNREEFMKQSAEILLRETDLTAEQIDGMTLSPEEIAGLKGLGQEVYLDKLGFIKQEDLANRFNQKTTPKEQSSKDSESLKSQSVHEIIRLHQKYFDDAISQHDNFKSYLMQNKTLTTKEKNTLVGLHNTAANDEIYGERLYYYLLVLEKKGKVDQEFSDALFAQSIDWPEQIKCDRIDQ